MKVTLTKLMALNEHVGKYLIMRMPEPAAKVDAQATSRPSWFKANNYIAPHHNAFEQGFVEEVFSRFLRQLS